VKGDGVLGMLENLLTFTDIDGAINLLADLAACLVKASTASYMRHTLSYSAVEAQENSKAKDFTLMEE
jgi:hypothetical protein